MENDALNRQIMAGTNAYISCDPREYSGYTSATSLFNNSLNNNVTATLLNSSFNNNVTAVIMYPTCSFSPDTASSLQQHVFSFGSCDSGYCRVVRDALAASSTGYVADIQLRSNRNEGNNTSGSGGFQNSQRPNRVPSNAVAMVILYSITGVITGLFLLIIITGALKAHRHPETYGPRNVLGRPRQSRARGIARAMLDTIPIVKFGGRDAGKPADVELQQSAPETTINAGMQSALHAEPNHVAANPEGGRSVGTTEFIGIGAATPVTAASAATNDVPSGEEGLGCSICTDDFEQGQDIRVLPCNHKFHPACVDPWLLNVSGTCPLW